MNEFVIIGACESCPSSTTTMKMGIERALKEKFGDSLKDVRQVFDDQPNETTVQVRMKNCYKVCSSSAESC